MITNSDDEHANEVRDALFSADRTYRYRLTRTWDVTRGRLLVIGLNPSTADESVDDATIRRLRGFAVREGLGALIMINLFARRATDPRDLQEAADPVGPANDEILRSEMAAAAAQHTPIVAAWGAGGTLLGRAEHVTHMGADLGVQLLCLGHTRAGHPRHPLYLRTDTPLVPL